MCAAALALCTGAAMAETRALLVGVSDYENDVPGLTDLRGPANDVRLMRDVLGRRGVSDIRVLADGVEGRPTRDAILTALAGLATDAEEGDFVYLHFSGHGTRQADPEGDETDGQDEVFLAADTGRAAPGAGRIPGAIVDDELGRAVAAIRAKGADVWLVLDSCHAGSGLRAGSPGTAARFVDPAALGVPAVASVPRDGALDAGAVPDLPGGYLAFYAARSSEVAREVDLGDDTYYGLFTAKLAARLDAQQPISFRQLFQAVLSDLNSAALPGVSRRQTPSWEGSLIDAAVFGGAATEGLRRFRVEDDVIDAGTVHGLAEGTVVGLVADAADAPDAILGFAQMELVKPTSGFLRPVAADCAARAETPCPAAGSLPAGAAFAQVVARPLDLVTRLAPPADLNGDPLRQGAGVVRKLRAAMDEATAAGHPVVIDPVTWDVQVLWDGNRLWFGPRAEIGGRPVGLPWTNGTPLAPLLVRIAQAERLARTLSAVAAEASPLSPSPVATQGGVLPSSVDHLAPEGADVSIQRECERALAATSGPQSLPPQSERKQCDLLQFAAEGKMPGIYDVNRVYIDAKYCIRVDHELIEDVRQPRRVGPRMMLCSDCPGSYSAGEERMFFVISEAAENAESLNLEGILDTCSEGATRGRAGQAALDLFAAQARRPGTRGALMGFGTASLWVNALSWQILPKSEALARFGAVAPE